MAEEQGSGQPTETATTATETKVEVKEQGQATTNTDAAVKPAEAPACGEPEASVEKVKEEPKELPAAEVKAAPAWASA